MTLASSVKRSLPSAFEDVDSENVDPIIFSSAKKPKGSTDYPLKVEKPSQFVLANAFTAPRALEVTKRPISTPRRLEAARKTPAPKLKTSQPSSAPAAAGRSPKGKRHGILSRLRGSSSPFTRIDPPSFGGSNGLPFSINAALSNTVSSYKVEKPVEVSTSDEYFPKEWLFDIHEDHRGDKVEDINFEHDTDRLDISDDSDGEGRLVIKDTRGKENIPPTENFSVNGVPVTTVRSVSRKDMMTDEPRTPLGDLNAKDYYAEGCDDSSVIVIPAQSDETNTNNICHTENHVIPSNATETYPDSHNGWMEFLSQGGPLKQSMVTALATPHDQDASNEAEIEIWESDSAKAENESCANEVVCASL